MTSQSTTSQLVMANKKKLSLILNSSYNKLCRYTINTTTVYELDSLDVIFESGIKCSVSTVAGSMKKNVLFDAIYDDDATYVFFSPTDSPNCITFSDTKRHKSLYYKLSLTNYSLNLGLSKYGSVKYITEGNLCFVARQAPYFAEKYDVSLHEDSVLDFCGYKAGVYMFKVNYTDGKYQYVIYELENDTDIDVSATETGFRINDTSPYKVLVNGSIIYSVWEEGDAKVTKEDNDLTVNGSNLKIFVLKEDAGKYLQLQKNQYSAENPPVNVTDNVIDLYKYVLGSKLCSYNYNGKEYVPGEKTTDDFYITEHLVLVFPEVSGTIDKVIALKLLTDKGCEPFITTQIASAYQPLVLDIYVREDLKYYIPKTTLLNRNWKNLSLQCPHLTETKDGFLFEYVSKKTPPTVNYTVTNTITNSLFYNGSINVVPVKSQHTLKAQFLSKKVEYYTVSSHQAISIPIFIQEGYQPVSYMVDKRDLRSVLTPFSLENSYTVEILNGNIVIKYDKNSVDSPTKIKVYLSNSKYFTVFSLVLKNDYFTDNGVYTILNSTSLYENLNNSAVLQESSLILEVNGDRTTSVYENTNEHKLSIDTSNNLRYQLTSKSAEMNLPIIHIKNSTNETVSIIDIEPYNTQTHFLNSTTIELKTSKTEYVLDELFRDVNLPVISVNGERKSLISLDGNVIEKVFCGSKMYKVNDVIYTLSGSYVFTGQTLIYNPRKTPFTELDIQPIVLFSKAGYYVINMSVSGITKKDGPFIEELYADLDGVYTEQLPLSNSVVVDYKFSKTDKSSLSGTLINTGNVVFAMNKDGKYTVKRLCEQDTFIIGTISVTLMEIETNKKYITTLYIDTTPVEDKERFVFKIPCTSVVSCKIDDKETQNYCNNGLYVRVAENGVLYYRQKTLSEKKISIIDANDTTHEVIINPSDSVLNRMNVYDNGGVMLKNIPSDSTLVLNDGYYVWNTDSSLKEVQINDCLYTRMPPKYAPLVFQTEPMSKIVLNFNNSVQVNIIETSDSINVILKGSVLYLSDFFTHWEGVLRVYEDSSYNDVGVTINRSTIYSRSIDMLLDQVLPTPNCYNYSIVNGDTNGLEFDVVSDVWCIHSVMPGTYTVNYTICIDAVIISATTTVRVNSPATPVVNKKSKRNVSLVGLKKKGVNQSNIKTCTFLPLTPVDYIKNYKESFAQPRCMTEINNFTYNDGVITFIVPGVYKISFMCNKFYFTTTFNVTDLTEQTAPPYLKSFIENYITDKLENAKPSMLYSDFMLVYSISDCINSFKTDSLSNMVDTYIKNRSVVKTKNVRPNLNVIEKKISVGNVYTLGNSVNTISYNVYEADLLVSSTKLTAGTSSITVNKVSLADVFFNGTVVKIIPKIKGSFCLSINDKLYYVVIES